MRGGLELLFALRFWAYASSTAKFARTEVSLGIMPGGGGTQTRPVSSANDARRN